MQIPAHWSRNLPEIGTTAKHADNIETTWQEIADAKNLVAQLQAQARKQEAAMMADVKRYWTVDEINNAIKSGMSVAKMGALQSLGVLINYD